jgi:uncharacterized membrane protein YdbT with pleckstrin-like domain
LIVAPILSIVIGCLFIDIGFSLMGKNYGWAPCVGLLGFGGVIGGLRSILPGFRGMTTEFVLTNKRILSKTGLVNSHQREVLISSITKIDIKQSLTKRAWNYGTLILSDAGGKQIRFPSLSNINAIQEKLGSLLGF